MSIFIRNYEYKIIKEMGEEEFGRVLKVERDDKYYVIKEIEIEEEKRE